MKECTKPYAHEQGKPAGDPRNVRHRKRKQRYGGIAGCMENPDESDDDETELTHHLRSARNATVHNTYIARSSIAEDDLCCVAAGSEHLHKESEDLRGATSRKRRHKCADDDDDDKDSAAYSAFRSAGRDFARGDAPNLPMRLALQELETLSGMTTQMQEMVNRSKKHFELKSKCALNSHGAVCMLYAV